MLPGGHAHLMASVSAFLCAFAAGVAAAAAVAATETTDRAQEYNAKFSSAPEVRVDQGRLRGFLMRSRGGRPIYAFRAIPYAKPPKGALRFQEPVAADAWQGVLNASNETVQCVQKNYLMPPLYPVSGSEDCLFLNVYTPKLPPTVRLPVIVYIHGGGFFAGSSASYLNGPQYLLDHNVVFVTINYRLGALGFLSSGDERLPGNAGLKDQALALRWVRDNVEAFGGDAALVTIMGQSAGGASVHFHLLSPLSRGLFQRAISQSGTALSAWAEPLDPLPIFWKQAAFAGCDAASVEGALRCLRSVDAHALTEASHAFKSWDIDPLTVFRPVVEGSRRGAFLLDRPAALIRKGDFARVPWISGSVSEEGIIRALPILTNPKLAADLNARWEDIMPQLLELEGSPNPLAIWRNISDFYVGDSQPHVDISKPQPFINMYSDRAFLHGFRRSAQLHARAGHRQLFLYELSYRGRFSYSSVFGGGPTSDYGVSHCDDLLYLLYSPAIFPEMPLSGSMDEQALLFFTQMWVNFAKYGNPTPTITAKTRRRTFRAHSTVTKWFGTPEAGNATQDGGTQCWANPAATQWAPYQPPVRDRDLHFLRIDAAPLCDQDGCSRSLRMCMKKGFHKDRIDFWCSLPLYDKASRTAFSN